jgi:hypothetical protein
VGVGEEAIGSKGAGACRGMNDCPVETVMGGVEGGQVVCGSSEGEEDGGHGVTGLGAR